MSHYAGHGSAGELQSTVSASASSGADVLPWLSAVQAHLGELASTNQLHHALLFTGPIGIGKHLVAQHLAKQLLCLQPFTDSACGYCKSCLLVAAGHHPDRLELKSDQTIGVDAVRELSQFMQGAPQQGGARVVLLPQAHKMTEAAANALLKTLEEPGRDSFLLLQTAFEQQLLPTILSRCQRWLIAPVNDHTAMQWLSSQSHRPIPDYLLAYCAGAPLRALQLLTSGESEQIDQILQLLPRFICGEYALTEMVKTLEARSDATTILYWFVHQSGRLMTDHRQCQQLFQRLAQWCRDEQQILGQNRTLALTALLLDVQRLLR
jgi:DNA polymerase-3 subunit delta'